MKGVRVQALAAALFAAASQASGDGDFARILAPGAKVEKLAGEFKFTEGPVWVASRSELLFSDIPANRIMRLRTRGRAADIFRESSGQANGLTLDARGRLLACEHANRRVSLTEADGTVVALAERYRGKRLNSPNDLVVARDGTIYFTDPPYGVKPEFRELDFQGVYAIRPEKDDIELLVGDFEKPNGLAFSPDQKRLYIADTDRGHIRAFDVQEDGSLSGGEPFVPIKHPDGMKVDREGNIYCTSSDGIVVFSHHGRRLGVIPVPEIPANCAFGEADWKSLFMTCRTGLYRIRVLIPGIPVP